MLYRATEIQSLNVNAQNGELGKVKDLYFDSEKWTVRYLVVDTMKWLPGKKVLVSPIMVEDVNYSTGKINILTTKEKIQNGPSIDEHQPVSRIKENEINRHFSLGRYWVGGGIWGQGLYPVHIANLHSELEDVNGEEIKEDAGISHLRSVREIKGEIAGYKIKALDDTIGHITDFILEEGTWTIRYLVIDTGDWLPGRIVIVSPEWVVSIDWEESEVRIDLEADDIKNGPTLESVKSISRDMEDAFYKHYKKRPYWN